MVCRYLCKGLNVFKLGNRILVFKDPFQPELHFSLYNRILSKIPLKRSFLPSRVFLLLLWLFISKNFPVRKAHYSKVLHPCDIGAFVFFINSFDTYSVHSLTSIYRDCIVGGMLSLHISFIYFYIYIFILLIFLYIFLHFILLVQPFLEENFPLLIQKLFQELTSFLSLSPHLFSWENSCA